MWHVACGISMWQLTFCSSACPIHLYFSFRLWVKLWFVCVRLCWHPADYAKNVRSDLLALGSSLFTRSCQKTSLCIQNCIRVSPKTITTVPKMILTKSLLSAWEVDGGNQGRVESRRQSGDDKTMSRVYWRICFNAQTLTQTANLRHNWMHVPSIVTILNIFWCATMLSSCLYLL